MESSASTVMILPLIRMRSEDEDCPRHAMGRAKAAIKKNIGATSRTNRAKWDLIDAPLGRVRKRIALDE